MLTLMLEANTSVSLMLEANTSVFVMRYVPFGKNKTGECPGFPSSSRPC